MEEADYWEDSGAKPLADLGRGAVWWDHVGAEPGPGVIAVEALTDEGVLLSWFVYAPGADPEALLAKSEPVVRRVVPRVKDELPGNDDADDLPAPPTDVCELAPAEIAASPAGSSGKTYERTYVGGRYGGGWSCSHSTPLGVGRNLTPSTSD